MRVYQHSARCPVALRTFLHCNPGYWCFIPLNLYEAQDENLIYMRETSNEDPEMKNILKITATNNRQLSHYINCVPLPPAAYTFSYRQRQKQRFFFEQFMSLPVQEQPYSPIDLYQSAIVAVCKYRILIITIKRVSIFFLFASII